MPTSNYPNGFPNGVAIKQQPLVDNQNANGNVFWVDSVKGSNGNTGTFLRPFATIDYAVGRCTAAQGDKIYVAAGHTETVATASGLDLDVAGITVIFMGEGANRATINFTTSVNASVTIAAANVELVNPRFTAGIDALTGPVSISAANCSIINAEYYDGTSIDTTDCIIGVATATGLTIRGWRYVAGNEGGTQKQSHIQLNGVDNAILTDIDIKGDFATGNIENVTDEILNAHLSDVYLKNTNATPKPGIVLDANATGYADRVHVRIASGTTYVSSVAKFNWTSTALGYNADGETGDVIGTSGTSGPSSVGTEFSITSNVSSANLPNNTQTGGAITTACSGTLLVKEIISQVNAVSFAGPTNIEISTDNASGLTGADGPNVVSVIANFAANKTMVATVNGTTKQLPFVLENGSKLYIHGDDAAGSGGGGALVYTVFQRLTAGATIANADV